MSNEIVSLSIPDVWLIKPRRHHDARGYFVETYNFDRLSRDGISCTFVQDNLSFSLHRGTIRGLHYQTAPHTQAKLVQVLQGAAYDVAVDLRRGSPTYGRWCSATLSPEEGAQIFIPAGFAHAFCTLKPNTVVFYKVDGYYAKDCEGGLHWSDPDLAIEWPVAAADVLVSEKDNDLPFMRQFQSPFEVRA